MNGINANAMLAAGADAVIVLVLMLRPPFPYA
jgi:hypothetical protein